VAPLHLVRLLAPCSRIHAPAPPSPPNPFAGDFAERRRKMANLPQGVSTLSANFGNGLATVDLRHRRGELERQDLDAPAPLQVSNSTSPPIRTLRLDRRGRPRVFPPRQPSHPTSFTSSSTPPAPSFPSHTRTSRRGMTKSPSTSAVSTSRFPRPPSPAREVRCTRHRSSGSRRHRRGAMDGERRRGGPGHEGSAHVVLPPPCWSATKVWQSIHEYRIAASARILQRPVLHL
jgi:hypothetical protein